MKKVLFATSALVATAGMAAADVNLSGGGRLGLVYNSAGAQSIKVERRTTINIDGSGSTDSGLEFGARIRLRSDEGDGASTAASSNVYIGNDTWRVTVGNTSGAMITRLGYFQGSIGLTGLGWSNLSENMGTDTFLLNTFSSRGNAYPGGDVVRLDFNVGGLGISISTDQTGTHAAGLTRQTDLAVSYDFGDWNVAAGYAKNVPTNTGATVHDVWGITAAGSIGEFGVGLQYTDKSGIARKATLSGSYDFGDTTVTAFVANTKEDALGSAGFAATSNNTEYGIGFTHSLGGATLAGGVAKNWAGRTIADVGVRFSF
ncbi:MAG: porin [Rhodobacteraceae bacterium]|nr:porin [Paracoccaceae bacterium]